ncbi:PDIA3 (predicted) [Pycnogonum litorale]
MYVCDLKIRIIFVECVFTESNHLSSFNRCGHCKRLAPEYENAATILNANDPPVPLAKVDCTEPGKDTCSKYSVSGYPTLKIFKNGEFFQDYDGPRDASGIVKYMKTKVGPASIKIDSVEALEKKLASNQPILVGFLSDSGKLETFKKAADKVREDVVCVHTSSDAVMKKYGHTDVVVLYRSKVMKNKFEESEIKFEGEITGSELKKFVNDNALGLCGHRTMENTGKFSSSKPLVVAYYDVDYEKNPKGTNYWRNRIMKVAKNYKDKFVFAISNVQNFNYEMEELGLKGKPKTVQVGIRDPSNKKFPMSDEFSMDKFEEFLKSYLAGDLKAYIKSEQVPENNDGPVKVNANLHVLHRFCGTHGIYIVCDDNKSSLSLMGNVHTHGP